jgi:hypothetical protein
MALRLKLRCKRRVRSGGRAGKRENAARPLGVRGDGGNVASISGVLLSKDSTACGGGMVIRRECRAREKTCQDNSLWVDRGKKRGRYSLMELS